MLISEERVWASKFIRLEDVMRSLRPSSRKTGLYVWEIRSWQRGLQCLNDHSLSRRFIVLFLGRRWLISIPLAHYTFLSGNLLVNLFSKSILLRRNLFRSYFVKRSLQIVFKLIFLIAASCSWRTLIPFKLRFQALKYPKLSCLLCRRPFLST
jgi:hypothetical protein